MWETVAACNKNKPASVSIADCVLSLRLRIYVLFKNLKEDIFVISVAPLLLLGKLMRSCHQRITSGFEEEIGVSFLINFDVRCSPYKTVRGPHSNGQAFAAGQHIKGAKGRCWTCTLMFCDDLFCTLALFKKKKKTLDYQFYHRTTEFLDIEIIIRF